MLKKILLNCQDSPGMEREQPTKAGVSKLKSCLKKFWSLDLSPKEYAYLKGTTIFNPDVPDLKAVLFIEGLQQEAQHALSEVVQLLHPGDQERFARLLLTASMLQSITPSLITEVFFRPVIGQADLLELLADMLFFILKISSFQLGLKRVSPLKCKDLTFHTKTDCIHCCLNVFCLVQCYK